MLGSPNRGGLQILKHQRAAEQHLAVQAAPWWASSDLPTRCDGLAKWKEKLQHQWNNYRLAFEIIWKLDDGVSQP